VIPRHGSRDHAIWRNISNIATYLEVVEEFQILLLEKVRIRILLVQRADEESVYAEEWPKLLVEVGLFNIGTRCRRYPKLLRVALYILDVSRCP
jgi:hypothetical protein